MTIASGVQPFVPQDCPEMEVFTVAGHREDPVVMMKQVIFAGSAGAPDYENVPTGITVALSGASLTGGSPFRLKVAAVGYAQWANASDFPDYQVSPQGFWVVIQADAPCTFDGIQVDWIAYWL